MDSSNQLQTDCWALLDENKNFGRLIDATHSNRRNAHDQTSVNCSFLNNVSLNRCIKHLRMAYNPHLGAPITDCKAFADVTPSSSVIVVHGRRDAHDHLQRVGDSQVASSATAKWHPAPANDINYPAFDCRLQCPGHYLDCIYIVNVASSAIRLQACFQCAPLAHRVLKLVGQHFQMWI